mmetsp:Transcript_1729/g.4787  ORF Transcript_1729/g.4787 Transcript_1729/m.4787 type:complete len:248 (+) Transcript_1729:1740-2483(+)
MLPEDFVVLVLGAAHGVALLGVERLGERILGRLQDRLQQVPGLWGLVQLRHSGLGIAKRLLGLGHLQLLLLHLGVENRALFRALRDFDGLGKLRLERLELALLPLLRLLGRVQHSLPDVRRRYHGRHRLLPELPQELRPPCPNDNLVVYVRYVHLVHHVVVEIVFQDASEDVEGQIRPRVTHVRHIIHSRAACVPLHLVPLLGREGNVTRANERVVHHQLLLRRLVGGRIPSAVPVALHRSRFCNPM